MTKYLTVGDEVDVSSSSKEGANNDFGRHGWDVEIEWITLNLQRKHLNPYYSLLQENPTLIRDTRDVFCLAILATSFLLMYSRY